MAGALERNQRLLEQLSKDEVAMLLGHIDRLTDTAAKMLDAEKDLSCSVPQLRASFPSYPAASGAGQERQNSLSCAPCCAALSLGIIPM